MNAATKLRNELPDATIIETEGSVDEALSNAIDASTKAIGAAGGDGTVGAAAVLARKFKLPLAVVPGGTMNHFARDIGIEDIPGAVAAIKDGNVAKVDTAMIADKPFLNTSGAGFYTDLVDERERLEKKLGKWPAAMIALVRVLKGQKPLRLEIDGRRMRVWMVFAGNGAYGHSDGAPTRRVKINDGVLDVRVLKASSRLPLVRAMLASLPIATARRGVIESWRAPSVKIKSFDGPLRLAADGETFDGPKSFSIEKDEPLRVLVLAPKANGNLIQEDQGF